MGKRLSAHFQEDEFRCSCPLHKNGTEPVPIDPRLIELLEDIRGYAGIPLVITSGYRCPAHNEEAGGKSTSAHQTGEAADIFVSGSIDRFKLLEAAFMCGVKRIGVGKDFLHVDVSLTLPQEVAWGY
jgi:zinc D-Ala-D-Ala carboxypeptidase